MWPNTNENVDLVTFIEEILNRKFGYFRNLRVFWQIWRYFLGLVTSQKGKCLWLFLSSKCQRDPSCLIWIITKHLNHFYSVLFWVIFCTSDVIKRHKIQKFSFCRIFNVFHMQNITLVPEKRTANCFLSHIYIIAFL